MESTTYTPDLQQAYQQAKIEAINSLQTAALACLKESIEESIRLSKISLDIDNSFSKCYANLAFFLAQALQLEPALQAMNKAINIDPHVPEYYCMRSILLSGLGYIDEAIANYHKCIEINPDTIGAKFNLGCLLYLKGKYREGMELMESRFLFAETISNFRKRFLAPDWDGKASLEGKTLLIYNEQGMGDAIQYLRYIPKLPPCHLIVEIQEEIAPLMEGFFDKIITRPSDYVDYQVQPIKCDYVVSFSSLTYLMDPNLESIPECPYLAIPSSNIPSTKLKVGLIWAGGILHANDSTRSMPVQLLLPLSEIPGIQYYSLQKGCLIRQEKDLNQGRFDMIDLSPLLTDFSITREILNELDLLISVDTATVHLAGAMGKPVWMMTAFCNDHRWLKDREDSPWYPSLRIFRQKSYGDWNSVVSQIKEALIKKMTGLEPKPTLNSPN